jgi:predicted O-linked N-acetylglucosamine transferase (SPINDLY family)
MGVPVLTLAGRPTTPRANRLPSGLNTMWPVTLAGRTSVARMGVRFLRNVGLDELIAQTPEAYLALATALAADLPRLAALRRGLRERMSRSLLMDAPRFTRHLEDAYRGMWERWVARVGVR